MAFKLAWLLMLTAQALRATRNIARVQTRNIAGGPPTQRKTRGVAAAEPSARRTVAAPAAGLALSLATASPAAAAQAGSVPSALFAYGHFLGLILVVGALTAERVLLKEDMTPQEFDTLAAADITYGVAGTLILVTGYFRVTQYAKGWDFYAHEPVFWFKMVLFAVVGAASFFPTIKIVQHAIAKKNAEDAGEEPIVPLSPALVARMTSIVNAELLAVGSIPLAASLMARGVGYAEWL
eukprot:CAMPEP_0119278860 /NCGR_PEP_ID=MMETSP1329-20130426/19823_1 /TAXON_ID=114041 /ORGANISM="Genus nov. species nov., Strain RCC1024" /LENGTH=237 /DNA_ID=CAMNT_0007279389 /DNA_START=65 /DNA_END=774 /DNA_ORIENTATION=+